MPRVPGPLRRFVPAVELILHEMAKFGIVGVVNFGLDVALFNVLLFSVLEHKPLSAKAISTTVAATSSYFMNRHWTWRHRARTGLSRELPLFLVLSAIGLGITESCLAFSHYLLGLDSKLADNISANGFGLVLGTIFRFWSFKRFVFLEPTPADSEAAVEATLRSTF